MKIDKRIVTGIQIFFAVFLLFLLFQNFDWKSFLVLLEKIPVKFFIGSLAAILVGQILYALKWVIILRGMGIQTPFFELIQYYLIGIFFNNFLPTSIGGDGFRIYYLGKKEGYRKVGATVFLDRFLGFFSVTIFATIFCWSIPEATQGFAIARTLLLLLLILFAIIVLSARILWVEAIFLNIFSVHRRLEIVRINFEKVFKEVRIISKEYAVILKCMGLVFLYYYILTLVYSTFFNIMTNTQISDLNILVVLLSIGILSNIPISINGIGLREQLHYILFASFGLPKEVTVSISLLIFADILIVSLLGYVFWLKMRVGKKNMGFNKMS